MSASSLNSLHSSIDSQMSEVVTSSKIAASSQSSLNTSLDSAAYNASLDTTVDSDGQTEVISRGQQEGKGEGHVKIDDRKSNPELEQLRKVSFKTNTSITIE